MTSFSKKIRVVGSRICEKCGEEVLMMERTAGDRVVPVSECLNCINLETKRQYEEFVKNADSKKHEYIYEQYSLVPFDLEKASFDSYIPNHPTQSDALQKARWYADNFSKIEGWNSLILKGPYGVGKSHLAKSISDGVRSKNFTVIYIDTPTLMNKIKNTFGNKAESSEKIFDAIEAADLVIFDDLGAERVKTDEKGESWVGEVLFQMFSARTSKPKVITTNCGSGELSEKYGQNGGRIVSRMMKGTKLIIVEGKDMRVQDF